MLLQGRKHEPDFVKQHRMRKPCISVFLRPLQAVPCSVSPCPIVYTKYGKWIQNVNKQMNANMVCVCTEWVFRLYILLGYTYRRSAGKCIWCVHVHMYKYEYSLIKKDANIHIEIVYIKHAHCWYCPYFICLYICLKLFDKYMAHSS